METSCKVCLVERRLICLENGHKTLATFLSKCDNNEDGIINHITSFLLRKLKALNVQPLSFSTTNYKLQPFTM